MNISTSRPIEALTNYFMEYDVELTKNKLWELFKGWSLYFEQRGELLSTERMIHFYESQIALIHAAHDLTNSPTTRYGKTKSIQGLIEFIILVIEPEQIYRYDHITHEKQEAFIELLIVLPDNCQRPFSKVEQLLELVTINQQRIYCTIFKSENIYQELNRGHIYYSLTCTDENLIYSSGKERLLPKLTDSQIGSMKSKADQCFQIYLTKAVIFYSSAKNTLKDTPGGNSIVLFMLHQSLELLLRGLLMALLGIDKRTHELCILIKYAYRLLPQLNDILPINTEDEVQLIKKIDESYLKARYSNEYYPEEKLVDYFVKKTETVFDLTERAYNDFIYQIGSRQ